MQKTNILSILLLISLNLLNNNVVVYCAPAQSHFEKKSTQGEASINIDASKNGDNIYKSSSGNEMNAFQLHSGKLPEMKDILNISKEFFTLIVKKSVDEATQPLFKIFPISDKSKNKLTKDIKGLTTTIGPMIQAEYIGYRTIGSLKRFFTLYFISYHGIMPLAWELTFYQPIANSKWQLNFIRFNSDHMYEFLKYPMLRLNQIQKNIKRK